MQLSAQNIILRDWTLEDLETYRNWNTGQFPWMDFNGPYYANLTKEELERFIQVCQIKIKEDTWPSPRKKLVIADKRTNAFIGTVNWYWTSKETWWKCIGIVICDHNFWSKGIGYEALSLWINYLFETVPEIVRLDLRTWSGNHGMIKLAQKLGFQQEACFRKARIVKGKYYDSIGMGILREEWVFSNPQQKL